MSAGGADRLDVVAARDDERAGRLALVTDDVELSYAKLAERVESFARALAALGPRPGSRVALRASNCVETLVALHACAHAGVAVAPLHPRLGALELEGILEDLRPDLVLDDDVVVDLATRHAGAPATAARPRAPEPSAELALVHTSGTSARPKIAVLPRSAFLASAAASAENLGWRANDRWLLCLPVCHVGGLSVVTRCAIAGATVVLLPRFEPEAVLAAIERHGVTLISVVPTMLRALLDADRDHALSRVRAVLVGGAATPFSWLEECERTGVVALTTYGLTEACSQVTTQAPPLPGVSYRAEPGCGQPLRGVDVAILGESGEALPPGNAGTIAIRGPTRMRSYLGHEPLAAEAWLQTGDVGALDEGGRLHVYGRRDDVIVTGGENVSPLEVEGALLAAGAREALVFGVPDGRWGQVVAALIVAGPDLDWSRLASELARRLAPHKRPRRYARVDALPRTRMGKLDRRAAQAFAGQLAPLVY